MIARALLVAAGLIGLSVPLSAPKADEPDRADVVQMYRFAHCIVKHNSRGARRVLAGDYGDEAFEDSVFKFAKGHTRCLSPGTMEISGILIAGTLAEMLLRRDFDQAGLEARLIPSEPALQARHMLEYTALCAAVNYPSETSALLFSAVNSDEAEAAMSGYVQILPGCVREEQELRVNKLGLRAIAALAAYRIAQNNQYEAAE